MKSGKSYKRNLLLAATIVSLSVTMPMNVAYADDPTPTRGAYAAYTITDGTVDNHNFTTSDGSTTSYYKTNLFTLNLLNNINGSTVWLEGTQDNNNFSVVLPNNETRYFIHGYTKPDGWGDGERQSYEQNGNAAGNSTYYNNRTFNGLNSTVSGGAIYVNGKQQATAGHGSNLIGTMTADFINNSITNTDTSEKGLGGALHIWGPYAGIETLNSNFINNHITYGTAKSGGGALAIGEGYNQGESTVGLINGNFINNYIDAPSYNLGGAIYYEGSSYGDGEITSIGQNPINTTKFVGNHIIGSGQGGAIYAVNKIGSIYADFIGNYIKGSYDASRGGAIRLSKTSDEKNVGLITGDFIGNYITTDANNGTAYGGAIYNSNSVGSVTGDFIDNYVVSTYSDTYGGAVYNDGTITNLTSNFIGNYANGQDVYGGAIYNTGTITNLNGKFIENDAYSNVQFGYNAVGGAIANKSNGVIENISGDFIRNKAHTSYTSNSSMTATGGAIYNEGAKIGTINANFIENESQREAGAIYNNGNSSDNKGIGTISGNFIKNRVTGEIARDTKGGAISNAGTIDSLTAASFINNTVNSANGRSGYGGAIYNDGTIGYNVTTHNEWTGQDETKLTGGGILGGMYDGNTASTSGGAIYNNSSAVINIISADFENNSANANGGAVFNEGTIGIDNGYGYITDGGFIDSSFRNNSATESGGAIYNNSSDKPVLITAKTKDITFSGNKAANGASIYNTSSGGTSITADGGNVTFTNNTPTDSEGYGIYSAATLGLDANEGHTIKIDDSINISNEYADITVNQGYGYTGTVELNGKIKFNNSNQGIRVGMAGDESGTLKLGQTPANDTYNYLQTAGNFTLDLQNEHTGDNLVLKQLSGTATMKLNVDYDATANSMDKITVNGGSGTITLNAINVMNDNADFVNGTTAEYLDGAARGNITVISDAINSATDTGWLYVFTPTSTNGELSIARTIAYDGDLINAINDDLGGTYHPTSFSLSDNFTANRNFGALSTENRDEFTIFGNNHTISGDNNTYTGIEVASGKTLNLDNVTFSNVKTYDIQNKGTVNLTGNNTINTIADADTATGTININSGKTIFTGNTKQNTVEVKTGAQLENRGNITGDVTANINGATDYSIINKGTMTIDGATFKNTATVVDAMIESDAYSGALNSSGSGTITVKNSLFEGNSAKQTAASYSHYGKSIDGGAMSTEGGTVIIQDTVFKNNFTETADNFISSYGGAAYLRGTNLNLTGTYEYDSENPTQIIDSSTKFVGNRAGSKDSYEYGYGGALVTNFSGTDNVVNGVVFKDNISNYVGGALRNNNNLKDVSAYFDSNSVQSSVATYYTSATGGALINSGTITNLTSTFVNNFALHDYTQEEYQLPQYYVPIARGGAIFNESGRTITNMNSDFIGNYADATYFALGGALDNRGTIGTISSTFKDNYVINHKQGKTYSGGTDAYSNGGAIYNEGTINLIKNSVFDHNSALTTNEYNKAYGSAIYNEGTITTIQDSIFRNNTSGGVLYNFKTIGTISGSEFLNNADTAIVNTRYRSLINEISDSTFTGNNNGAILNSYTEYRDYDPVVIKSIDGTFTGNNRIKASYNNLGGGAIQNSVTSGYLSYKNSTVATIGNWDEEQEKFVGTAITGDFENNYVTSADNDAGGGAIANFTSYKAGIARIGDIEGKTVKGFKGNHVIVTGSGYSAMGGAIFNQMDSSTSWGSGQGAKIGNITANFTENYVQAVDEALGGAIYSVDTTGTIKGDFTGNYASANDARGGAIAGVTSLNIEDSSFYNNYTSGTTTSLGGAIYNEATTIIKAATKDIVFSGNKATFGAGVYNGGYGTLALYAKGGDILFENNNRTGSEGGNGTGIHSGGHLVLVAEEGQKITINDKVQANYNMYINSGLTNLISPVGTVEFTDTIYAAGNSSELHLDGGTLKLSANAAKSLNTDLNTSSDKDAFEKFISTGGTLDIQNNNIDKIKPLAASGSNISGAINLLIDVDTTADTGDSFVSDILAENVGVGSVIIKAINIMNDDAEDARIQVGLGSVSQIMELANDYVLSGGNYDITGEYDAEGHAYYLNLAAVNYDSINLAVTADDRLNKSYTLKNQGESGGETVTAALGNLVGHRLTVNGKNLFLDGDSKQGFVIGTYEEDETTKPQTLTLKNMTVKNFTTAVDNAGTLNVEGVTFTTNTTDINNTAILNLSGDNVINTITGNAGTTNITGGLTTIDYNGSVVQNAVNMQGGGLKIMNNATVNKVVGDENHTGSYIVAYGGSFSSLEGTFKGSNTYRALDYNSATALTIDGVTFDNNAAGAIYHSWSGAVDSSISNSTFTNNSTEYEGGAYYQHSTNAQDHTVSFDNVTFTSNSATNHGGAIYATLNAVNNLNISDSTFTSNTVTGANGTGSAIYLEGDGIGDYEPTPSSYAINNSTFTSNGAGGVVYANGGNLTVKNSTFTSNSGDAIVLADNYQYWTIIGGQIAQVYSPITANIVAETGNVAITDNSGWGIVGNKNHETDSALTLYAKSGNITINGNTAGGINNNGLVLTLNADTGHNITINDAVSSTTGITVNAGGTHAGTVALNGALTLGSALNVNGGTLTLNDTAASSMANKDLVLNGGALKLDSVAAAAIVNTNLGLNGGKFDIANSAIDNLTFTNAINNAVNSYIALDVSLGDTNTADKITSDISGASTINVSDINFISDNKNGGDVQIADGNIKGVIAVGADVAGGYADVQYNSSTGVLSFADKIDWLQQTNGANSGYRFTKTNNGIMPVNYTSGENNYTFYTDILKKNYTDDNGVAHDLKYTWNDETHSLTVTNSDDTALSTTKATIVRTGDGSSSAPFVYTGDHVGNTAIGLNRWNNFGNITGDFVGNTNGAISVGMGVNVGDITGNFIGNTGGSAVYIGGDGSWGSSISSIKGDFIGNSTTGSGSAIQIGYWSKYSIGTVTGDFIGNKANESGGAIYVQSRGTTLTGNFINNYAGDVGGAMLIGAGGHGANVTVTGDFIGNEAVNAGGAIYSSNGGTTTLIDSSFIGNIAPQGAAIYMNAGELTVTAQNKDIEFTNNNSTGTASGEGYGVYHKSSGYRPFVLNAVEGRSLTVNDKVYSEEKISINNYYSGDWAPKNGTVIFNNEFTQTGATEISSNESNAGGGTVIFNGTTSLADLDVSGTATLKLGAGAGTSTFGAVTFSRSPILDIANDSAQTLTVASIKNNAKLNIDLDFTGDSVLSDAINITTGGKTGVLTINDINAITSDTGAIREFTNLAILTGETDGVTLALSDAIQQDPRFNGDAVETITWESDYTDTATFANTVFTNTEYSETKQKHLYVVDGTKLSFDETTTIPKHATGNVTTQDVLQALNQSTSAARSLTTDDATATYTVGDNLGTTGTGSLSVTGTTSGSDASTLNMNGKSGFELSNSDTTLALSNLNITGIKDVDGGLINITGENSSANLTSVNIGGTTNSAIVNNKTLNLAGNTTINTGIKGSGTMNVNGNVALNGALTLSGTTNVTGGTLKLGTAAAGSAFNNIAFSNTPTLDLQNTTIDTLNVDKITGNSNLNIDVNYASSLADTIQIATTGSSGTITVDSLNFLGGSVPTSFNVYVLTQGTEGDISGITLAISDALAAQYNDPTPTATDYIKPYTYESNINFDKTDFTSEKWTRTTQKQLTVVDNTTSKGLNLDVNEISNEHKAGGAEDTHYDALLVLNQHEGTRTLKADGATANTYTVGDNLGSTATGTLNVTGKSSGSNLDMNNKTGFVVSNADTTLNLSNLNITNVSDTADGGLVTVSGTGSKANLENVTIANTTNSAISNAVELNLSGTNNLGTGIVGAAGTTNITGGKTTVGSITQNVVNITAGELEVANITATNGISNDGTLTLTGTANANTISGTGHTVIAGNVNNTGAINQAITVNGTKTLTTAANLIGGAVTNSGTVELTGGALGQTITGGDITIASGEVTSTVANLGGTTTNNSNLLLSGTLDKNIAGDSGVTKLNDNMTFADGAGVAGTLNFNGKAITMSGDDVTSTFNIGKINSDGTINIDVNTSGSPVSDVINITTVGSTGTITINSINEIGARGDDFTLNVLQGTTGSLQLALSDAVHSQFDQAAQDNFYYVSDAYDATIDFDKTSFDTVEWDRVTQKAISIEDNTKIKYSTNVISDTPTGNVTQKDALAFINQNTDTSAVADRSMVTSDINKTYTVQEDLGTTGAGTLLVQGASDKTTKLDMNNHSGFFVANSGTAVTLKDINVDNVQNIDGGLVNITNTGSSATLDGAVVNVKDNPENKANVISSNGTLGVTNSTVNAGVNNNGTMNLNGTNQIASVEGSNGTANVQAGTTTVGSIFQKLINIVTGGKLASNGDVTATNGITNDTANGLSVANGTLTGNVTGSGSTDFKGTSAIADGSTVGQAITVVDGKLTTLADGLGGAVTNGGEVDLTGGTLETSITGGNTTISGNVGVDDTLGSIASAVGVATTGKLTTNADNVTGVITNSNALELTGGVIQNTITGATGTTIIAGDVTNTTGQTVTQQDVEIASGASLTSDADKVTANITNAGTYTMTGGDNANDITGAGSTVIDGDVTNTGDIQNAITVNSGKSFESDADNIQNTVNNNGTYTVTGGDIQSDITGATGTTIIAGDVTNTTGQTVTQQDVEIASGASLTSDADKVTADITNAGTYTMTGGDNANDITGAGSTVIDGDVTNTGDIQNAITVNSGKSFESDADNIQNTVNNNGTYTVTGGDIQNDISGNGTTTISGAVTNTTDSTIGNAVTVDTTGGLTTAADKLGGAVENNGTTNGLTLTGGQLSQNVTGTGKTVIDGTDVSVAYGSSIQQDMTINSGKQLVNTNVSAIQGNVENNGNLQIYSQDNGRLENDITGTGTTELNQNITVAANVENAVNIKSYGTNNANVTVESGYNFGKAGESITVDSDNTLIMQDASDIKGNLTDNGTVELQGGTISNAISGTGDINITGNVINNAINTTTGAVTVAENAELAIGTTGNAFSNASSVTLDNGSTLNMQNGTASNTVMDNLVIADGDTVNLKMDWNDTINSASTNIGGNLSVTDINMSTTTGDDEYVMTTTLDDKVSVAENVNLSGVTESTSNFVNYNPSTGELISYKNSLVKAVDKTDTGMSATYVMTGDETAGGGELDGTLKVQGNGHSITTGGVVIGSTTIQNAELTLEDVNLQNITGDAIQVYGGNKGHMNATNNDLVITGNSGDAVKLIANGTQYAEFDFDAGSKTITIDNDITSDNKNNKVTFKGGTINFNGKFDPAMGVVGGATVNRGGDDDGIDWTVTSGTLNYLQDSYLNRATNTMNLNGGTLNTVNGVVTDFALGGFTLSNDSNFYADVDLAAGKMDNFLSTPTTYTGGTLHVAGLNLISDATTDNTSIPFANSTLAGHIDYTGAQGLTALSPIYKYNVGYNSSNGNFDFARYNSGGYDGLNPAIMAAPVAAQMGGYLTQLNSYDEAFRNMDMYMLMTAQQRQALKNKNKIASLDGGILYDQTLMRQERAEGWFRPFTTFEKVPLKNGPKVENIAYGTYMGGESEMYDLGHGWDGIWGAYVGYNGSHQNYDGVSIYQNGGTLGVLGMAYKGNFFTGLTINAGASGVEASTMYGNEDFAMLMAGIASKTGYNWELFNGKFIIQPSMLMSYSFVNTFDYRNAAGIKVDSDPLHAIQLQPELKFIGNLKNGWQPYASVAMVWNIMDDTKFKANDVSLPELSVKPYVKYGVGVRKSWGERFTGFFQTYLTNGGRNGVGLQAGFTWTFGGGKDKKADEKKIQKSLNKTPELKKTEIVLNGKKVQ